MTETFKGKKNIYVCEVCFGHIVTVDLDDGVTPFLIDCRATDDCRGLMQSSMYRVYDQRIAADHEWYRPSEAERLIMPDRHKDHVKQGGLLLRKVVKDG